MAGADTNTSPPKRKKRLAPQNIAVDMTGWRFGRLTVVGRSANRGKRLMWLCRCDCGSGVVAEAGNLRGNHTQSCGCTRRTNLKRPAIEMAGKKFGKLTVIERAGSRNGQALWRSRCECGGERIAPGSELRKKKVRSCGCDRLPPVSPIPLIDMMGARCGMLTVIARAENYRTLARWRCICDCGGESIVTGTKLRLGEVGSCGCARETRTVVRSERARRRSVENTMRRLRTDVAFALTRRVRALLRQSLKVRGAKKSKRTEELLGYSLAQLRRHLQKSMPPGHSWADFLAGRLEIDHRTPLAAFNYSCETDIDFKRAWALDNLQLLTRQQNRAKSDRLVAPFQPSLPL